MLQRRAPQTKSRADDESDSFSLVLCTLVAFMAICVALFAFFVVNDAFIMIMNTIIIIIIHNVNLINFISNDKTLFIFNSKL
jgi:hypothetical protein